MDNWKRDTVCSLSHAFIELQPIVIVLQLKNLRQPLAQCLTVGYLLFLISIKHSDMPTEYGTCALEIERSLCVHLMST